MRPSGGWLGDDAEDGHVMRKEEMVELFFSFPYAFVVVLTTLSHYRVIRSAKERKLCKSVKTWQLATTQNASNMKQTLTLIETDKLATGLLTMLDGLMGSGTGF